MMPSIGLSPALSVLAAFARFTPPAPLHTFLRSTGYKLRPPRPLVHRSCATRAQDELLSSGRAERRQLSTLLCERRNGPLPTIVLGGFVPDSTEQVFLFRGFFLRRGSVYYFNYPRGGFSAELFCAQLDDLVNELNGVHGQCPVILGVSFGAGLLLEWLRRNRAAGRTPDLSGTIIVSPVACSADVLDPAEAKPSTLLGRAVKPFVDAKAWIDGRGIEKSRAIFAKMFEAGAQNKAALRTLLTPDEFRPLRDRVLASIQEIDSAGAVERVQAMCRMPPLSAWTASPGHLPLSEAPALILFAEKESAVLTANSPTREALTSMLPAFFPSGKCQVVTGHPAHAVQHASLIFHYFQFLPHIVGFYRELKSRNFRLAA
jgi:hypothetical protein